MLSCITISVEEKKPDEGELSQEEDMESLRLQLLQSIKSNKIALNAASAGTCH